MHEARKTFMKRITCAIAAALLAAMVVPMAGCGQPTSDISEEQAVTASTYMVNLNQAASELSASLSEFAEVTSDGNVSAMQVKADAAIEVMDKMANLEAPDELSDVKDKYNQAIDTLKGALSDYMALYLEIENEPDPSDFNYNTYAARIEAVQKAYDEGLNLLEEADQAAAEL